MRRPLDFSRREFVLLALLVLCILFFAHSSQPSYSNARYSDSDVEALDGIPELPWDNAEVHVPRPIKPAAQFPTHTVSWTSAMPETTIVQHVAGWTVLDSLYIFNGTIFVVTSDPQSIPERKLLTSSGYEIWNGPVERAKRLPSDQDIQVVTPEQAQQIFKRNSATLLDGASFLVTDPKQFINHYYHFAAELVFGLWRTYVSLDPTTRPDGKTTLPLPRRLMFTHIKSREWTDYSGMNQWITRGAFSGMGVETIEDWEDRAKMQTVFVYERVVLADRAAAGEGDPFKYSWRTASNAFGLPGNENWWLPLRRSVLEFSGVPEQWIAGREQQKYVITYISRQQWGRRTLIPEDHDVLVRELYDLRDKYGYEVNVVSMEKLSRAEQVSLMARTTIMMGVHGNGLTSLMWMRPTPRSTVIEFFIPEGFAFDYEWTTRACGMRHYAVWNDKLITHPNVQRYPTHPEGFQGNSIPLDGKVVAKLVHERLTEPVAADAHRSLFLAAGKPHAKSDP